MDKSEILSQLEVIFRNVLDNKSINLNENSSAEDIEEWDSLAHVQLIGVIQDKFGIRFSAKEMLSWENVGQMVDCIAGKI
jgi:acyl carrier protein